MEKITVKNMSFLSDGAAIARVGMYVSGEKELAVTGLDGVPEIVIEQDGNTYTVKNLEKKVKRITATVGICYINKNGSAFVCLSSDGNDAVMQRVSDGYTIMAHGIQQYENGEIEWDYSTGGRFEEVKTNDI